MSKLYRWVMRRWRRPRESAQTESMKSSIGIAGSVS
jgi:hypothetical protein